MSDKDFKVKNKLQVKGITAAGPVISDASGNLDSTAYIATQYGGTGTATSPSAGQFLYSSGGTTYAPVNLSSYVVNPLAQTSEPSSLVDGLIWVDTDGTAPTATIVRWSKVPGAGVTALSGNDDNGVALYYTAGYEEVFLNGVLLSRGNDYTATNGSSITLSAATVAGDIVEVISPLQIQYADTITKSTITAKGDIIVGSGSAVPTNLAIGTGYQSLVPDSTQSTGIKWSDDHNVLVIMGALL